MNARLQSAIHQPVYPFWSDARFRASVLAQLHGYAVIIGKSHEFKVIAGINVETCMGLACGQEILADFNEDGRQTS